MTIGSGCVRQRAIVCVYVDATTKEFESCARERAVLCVCACVWLWMVSIDTIGFEMCVGERTVFSMRVCVLHVRGCLLNTLSNATTHTPTYTTETELQTAIMNFTTYTPDYYHCR